ncbi:hypothetical protein SPRG_03425 [Saprolegnia parasitica CBS 223.65]|uniref:TsaA-like domain-containing protein n=1 Tax=Saprolegnia parasitica (strain CBS 223.65) TaxID=695850 RepID=A0A067CP11_SAPPC|nr:hypothetical protein SPRG_03425 [Saprolegnia parasitica CBS 223.65]KDO32208.1 hypothetical protein SPRG_03425 [Saprolegnia parasitica CBS 223.65]|eukprot:XP_012197388.1 hypothetical protein SPRG_03425 [Saprolegnia parasitica CBS 223.65]
MLARPWSTLLRAQERLGRTNAERDARLIAQQQLDRDGYNFEPIGSVESCFADRRGTPRQGALVPASKARIRLVTSVPPASLECLDQFSHVWVLFVFHENTNVSKVAANKKTTYPAKIAPPRLGGKKVGLFSTRTPHRPNSIGLTVVKLDAVYDRTIEISGHDFVHGTPILDVKPYVPYDRVDDLECPEWVMERHDILPRPVEFADEALAQLEAAINSKQLEFYQSVDELKDAIAQILVLDIRSVHQKRGQATDALFSFRLDKLRVEFATLEASIRVVQCAIDAEASLAR